MGGGTVWARAFATSLPRTLRCVQALEPARGTTAREVRAPNPQASPPFFPFKLSSGSFQYSRCHGFQAFLKILKPFPTFGEARSPYCCRTNGTNNADCCDEEDFFFFFLVNEAYEVQERFFPLEPIQPPVPPDDRFAAGQLCRTASCPVVTNEGALSRKLTTR